MNRRNRLNGKRLYFLTLEASSEEIRKVRNLLDLEDIRLISERHKPLSVRLMPFLIPIFLIFYFLNIIPDAFSVWYPLTMLLAGKEVFALVE